MAKLTAAERNKLGSNQFAIPSKRAYPIHDMNHAKDALARSSGKKEEAQVKTAVHKKWPQLRPKVNDTDKDGDSSADKDKDGY